AGGRPDLFVVALPLVHEVTSPQAFEGLRLAGRAVRRPDLTVATMDHNVPTAAGPVDPVSRTQMEALERNCSKAGITLFPTGDLGQGIVHVIGPQMGLTQPGLMIVCGDSHTSGTALAGGSRWVSVRARSSMSWRRRRCRNGHRTRWRSPSRASCRPASRPRPGAPGSTPGW